MPSQPMTAMKSRCACGGVEFETLGAPIASVLCYCSSCQKAGRAFERLPAAPAVLEPDGGTSLIVFRKDRVRCARGGDRLEEHRLKPESPTRRLVATCCNSVMLLDFTRGHWLSMNRRRFATDAPEAEMRIMTRDRRDSVPLANDLPNHSGHSGRAIVKLLAARIAMGFRIPKVEF